MIPNAPVDDVTGLSAARFGLYVHFPYCLSKCPYCDFASTAAKVVPEERYAKAIATELELRLSALGRRPELHTIYFGGGTPSLWAPRYVGELLSRVAGILPIAARAEITLEANPGAADAERFTGFRNAGINRLSMGVQSFQPRTLKALGREHDGAQARRAYAAARKAGFENVSLDFIYGVHGQTLAEVEADALEAASLGPEHLSAYALTLDKESLAEEVPLARQLSRGEVALPADDDVVAMQRAVAAAYQPAGLQRYEVSNYAKPGYHSRHNTLYWTGGEYLAVGVGATGFWKSGAGGVRYSNQRSAEKYLTDIEAGRSVEVNTEPLDAEALSSERVAMGLRLVSGVNLQAARGRALSPDDTKILHALAREGLIMSEGDRVRLTPAGFDVHSAIAARLM